jgi:hypothetical protein
MNPKVTKDAMTTQIFVTWKGTCKFRKINLLDAFFTCYYSTTCYQVLFLNTLPQAADISKLRRSRPPLVLSPFNVIYRSDVQQNFVLGYSLSKIFQR